MFWINFLHLYQPANTDAYFIQEATEKSYLRLIKVLEKNPHLNFTFNIQGCLLYRWSELGYADLFRRIRELVRRGQLELTGSACYHPILPLMPKEEIIRQVRENEEAFAKNLGLDIGKKGFFLPEMAYSPAVAKVIKSLGYKWLILDEMALGRLGTNPMENKYYQDGNSGLKAVLRLRKVSNSYVPKTIERYSQIKRMADKVILSATDAELYGLRFMDRSRSLEKVSCNRNVKTLTVGKFIDGAQNGGLIYPKPHSWETTEKEYRDKEPFNIWRNPKNEIQNKIWQLFNFVHDLTAKNKKDANHHWARWHLVRGAASCTFWWASAKNFNDVYGPVAWNPDRIERGIEELIRAVRSLEGRSTRPAKIKAEKMYAEIKKSVWENHWKYYWKKNYIY